LINKRRLFLLLLKQLRRINKWRLDKQKKAFSASTHTVTQDKQMKALSASTHTVKLDKQMKA